NTQGGKRIDIAGDGKPHFSGWAGKGEGVLAVGKGNGGKELIGTGSDIDGDGKPDGYANGFEALAALERRFLGPQSIAEGKLDVNDLAALEQKTDLHLIVDGKKKSLADAGVKEIDLGYSNAGKAEDLMGNEHRQQGSFSRTDGRKGKVDSV